MNIKRVGNIILEVRDLDISIKFYHKLLGMPIKNERRNWVDLGQESGGVLSFTSYVNHHLTYIFN